MGELIADRKYKQDAILVVLAREIAMDLNSIETILETLQIDEPQWEEIKANPRFQTLLESEVIAWQSASNTAERVKLKAASMIEEWLPELYTRMNDGKEALTAKIEAGKLAARLAELGLTKANVEGVGEKFSITINLGADNQLTFNKQLPPQVTKKVIEGEVISE
jgi:hypothetical protein